MREPVHQQGRKVPAQTEGRRPANRHYLAVVAQEARRLGHQFHSSAPTTRPVPMIAPTTGEAV